MAFSELDKLLIEQIKNFRAEGFTIPEIAEELDVSTSKIETLISRANLPRVSQHKISVERMTQLNNAAKAYGYKSFDDITKRSVKINVAKYATRRAEGKVIGKGKVIPTETQKVTMKEKHWMKGMSAAEKRAYIQKINAPAWAKKTKIQRGILAEVEKGILDSKKIAKNLGVTNKKLIDESEKLFKNVYQDKLKLNKGARPTSTFLPPTTEGLNKLLTSLREVKGFSSPEAQTWFKLVRDAKEAGRITAKQFTQATGNVKEFFDLAHRVREKYPTLKLNLDHPLSRGTLALFDAKGEKFLTGMPSTERFNKGIKESLDVRYRNLIRDIRQGVSGAGQKKTALENLAKDLKIDIGEVSKTGKRITSLGQESIVLGEAPVGESIIKSLEKQNILAKNIKNVNPELVEAAGMDQYFKKAKLPEIPAQTIEGIRKLFNEGGYNFQRKVSNALNCGKGEGGRIGYALGTATIKCVNTKLTNEPVQSSMKLRVTEGIGKIRPAATNFLKLLGRGGLKAAPLAALAVAGAAIEPLVKQFRNDDPSTYLTDENQMKGMLLATIEGETPKVDEEILKWQTPALGAATAAGAIPGAREVYLDRLTGRGPAGPAGTRLPATIVNKPVGKARAVLGLRGVAGKALGASFSPLAVAATLPLSVAAQRKGGTEWGDIATDPMNWMGPAFASTGAQMATRGMKPTGIIAQAIRLGIGPRALMAGSRFLGWPGLAISAGLWGYDKWKNRSINDE